jgi:hypothetical protein
MRKRARLTVIAEQNCAEEWERYCNNSCESPYRRFAPYFLGARMSIQEVHVVTRSRPYPIHRVGVHGSSTV